jgi:succinate dehydrogenase flavin-adding protein (antitoxin of CptAB toxin-antitoxin module)
MDWALVTPTPVKFPTSDKATSPSVDDKTTAVAVAVPLGASAVPDWISVLNPEIANLCLRHEEEFLSLISSQDDELQNVRTKYKNICKDKFENMPIRHSNDVTFRISRIHEMRTESSEQVNLLMIDHDEKLLELLIRQGEELQKKFASINNTSVKKGTVFDQVKSLMEGKEPEFI